MQSIFFTENAGVKIELPYGHPLHQEEYGDQYTLRVTPQQTLWSSGEIDHASYFLEIYNLRGEQTAKISVEFPLGKEELSSLYLSPSEAISPWRGERYNFCLWYPGTYRMIFVGGEQARAVLWKNIKCMSKNISPHGSFSSHGQFEIRLHAWDGDILITKPSPLVYVPSMIFFHNGRILIRYTLYSERFFLLDNDLLHLCIIKNKSLGKTDSEMEKEITSKIEKEMFGGTEEENRKNLIEI